LYRERIESLPHASSHQELRGVDLTQEEFTRRIGISLNYLSTMELGKVQIGSEILLRIKPRVDRVAAGRGRPEVHSREGMKEFGGHHASAGGEHRRCARRHVQRFLSRQKKETSE
jgi:hypothetical protein